jgi:hypothetical protein
MRVEVATSEAHGLSTPRRFRLDGREVEVVEVLDQWFGADYRYSKVKGDDGALYILRLDENRSEWTLTMYASPEAQALAHNPGSTCIKTGNRFAPWQSFEAEGIRCRDLPRLVHRGKLMKPERVQRKCAWARQASL